MRIACFGMSHLGLVTALSFAMKGHKVFCFDLDTSLIEELNSGEIPIQEPDYCELFTSLRENLVFSNSFSDLPNCELYFITKDVTTDENGSSDFQDVVTITSILSEQLHPNSYVVLLSQITPGFTRRLAERFDLVFVYQVETLVFGQAIRRACNPERFIVGVKSETHQLAFEHQQLLESFDVPIIKMEYESAELSKIAINLFLASSVTTTNSIAEICEVIGADWRAIVPALQLDSRIGKDAYLKPGLGLSGGNIERDLANIIKLSVEHKTSSRFFEAFRESSYLRKSWPTRVLRREIKPLSGKNKIAVWGLTYKKNTNSVKNSPSIFNLEMLEKEFEIHVSDPILEAQVGLHENIVFHANPLDCLESSDALLVLTDWPEYAVIAKKDIVDKMNRPLVIDPYGLLMDHFKDSELYFTLGRRNHQ